MDFGNFNINDIIRQGVNIGNQFGMNMNSTNTNMNHNRNNINTNNSRNNTTTRNNAESVNKETILNKYKKQVYKRIEELFKNKNYEAVINETKDFLKYHKDDILCLKYLLKTYFIEKEFYLAKQLLKNINSNDFEIIELHGKILFEEFKNEEVNSIIDDIISIYNDLLSEKLHFNQKFKVISNIYLLRKLKKLQELEKLELKKASLKQYLKNQFNNNEEFNKYEKYFEHVRIDNNFQPPGLTCNMTLELIAEPVTLEYGNSYEEKMIYDYFNKNSQENNEIKDPSTNKPINNKRFYKNVYLKKAIKDYIRNNPFSWDSYGTNNWREIELN